MDRAFRIIVCALFLTGTRLALAQDQSEVKKSSPTTQPPPPAAVTPPPAVPAPSAVSPAPSSAWEATAPDDHSSASKDKHHRMKACDKDIAKFCPGAGEGKDREACLGKHAGKLSENCKLVWARWGPKPGSKGGN
jgi:hypothetical protein